MTMINEYLTVITRCGYCTCQLLAKSTLIRIKLIHGQYTVRLRLIYTISVYERKIYKINIFYQKIKEYLITGPFKL